MTTTTTTTMDPLGTDPALANDDLRDAHVAMDPRPKSGPMRTATLLVLAALALALATGVLFAMYPTIFVDAR